MTINQIRIRHIYLSDGHNYFGHHGKPPDHHGIREADEVECVAGRGIVGDRFFDYKENYKGQITFFEWEVFCALCDALHARNRDPSALRRNVITEGVSLIALIGKTFEIQGIRFAGMEECRPCYWMDQAIGPDAENQLQGRGGLRARILTDGMLRRTPADAR